MLITNPGGIYVDGTTGMGGHSKAILDRLNKNGRLICLERDPEALEIAGTRLGVSERKGKVIFRKANFADMGAVLESMGIEKVDGIFLDLGMSSFQLDKSGRGFSFNRDEPLDMRMDNESGEDAQALVNRLSSHELETILKKFGEEKRARAISRSIVRERNKSPIRTSGQLAKLIRSNFPSSRRSRTKDPATRTFQALRIAVNNEMENLNRLLDIAPDLLIKGGRIIFLTYHSLEDRGVKKSMVDWEKSCICPDDLPVCACGRVPLFRRLTRRGIQPQDREIETNPRARSARLRGAERI